MPSTCNYMSVVVCLAAFSACAPSPPASAAPSSPPPYSREEFGDGWASTGHGCDVRDLVLARDVRDVTNADRCGPLAGRLDDPYSGVIVIGPTRQLDIDHLVPLEYAHEHGAWRWSKAQRVAFANDLNNLQTTTAKQNRAKGSRGPGEWLPKDDPCTYATRFDSVADRYGLVDPSRDAVVAGACQ